MSVSALTHEEMQIAAAATRKLSERRNALGIVAPKADRPALSVKPLEVSNEEKQRGVRKSVALSGKVLQFKSDDEIERISTEESAAQRRRKCIAFWKAAGCPKRQADRREFERGTEKGEAWLAMLAKLKPKLGSGVLLAFLGARGNGKSQMATELIRETCSGCRSALYITATRLFMQIKASWRSESKVSEEEVVEGFSRKQLLVIDEIGRRSESDWEDRVLFELLDTRYREGKDTILCSNQPQAEFELSVGPSVVSRLNETGGIVEFSWKSFRFVPGVE